MTIYLCWAKEWVPCRKGNTVKLLLALSILNYFFLCPILIRQLNYFNFASLFHRFSIIILYLPVPKSNNHIVVIRTVNLVTKNMFDFDLMTSYQVQRPSYQQCCRPPLFCLVRTGSSELELRRLSRLVISWQSGRQHQVIDVILMCLCENVPGFLEKTKKVII